jgi:hypothetical protein
MLAQPEQVAQFIIQAAASLSADLTAIKRPQEALV